MSNSPVGLLQPDANTPIRTPSIRSGKQPLAKSIKHAFSRRKRSGSFRTDSEIDVSSQRSVSVDPEDSAQIEEIMNHESPSPQRGRSPSRRFSPNGASVSSRPRSRSVPRSDIETEVLTSPLPQPVQRFTSSTGNQEVTFQMKPNLSLQTQNNVPSMSITPATPVGLNSAPTTPEKVLQRPTKPGLGHQRSGSRLSGVPSPSHPPIKEEKATASPGFVGGAVWGSLVNAANKVTDTISSLTNQGSSGGSQITRSISAAPLEQSEANELTRPRSQTLPNVIVDSNLDANVETGIPKSKAIDTLGEGELSLKELGFESDSGVSYHIATESSLQPVSTHEFPPDEEPERYDIMKTSASDLTGSIEHLKTENASKTTRSLTVPISIRSIAEAEGSPTLFEAGKPRRLSSLSRRSDSRRNESIASRTSSDAPLNDDSVRGGRKRSSLTTAEGAVDPSKPRNQATANVSEDPENEEGLYIHGRDGKRHKIPIAGFAVRSGKRNRDFHSLFKSVEDSDYLIEDYSCALSKEILVQGRMYVSEHYICFNSNIFGWVTNLVIAFGEVVSIEKRSTAVLFPNGIQITTLHAKYIFASFVSRDSTYDLLTSIWRLSHPDSRSPDDQSDYDSASVSSRSYSDDRSSLSDQDGIRSSRPSSSENEEDTEQLSDLGPASDKGREENETGGFTKDIGPENHEKTECDCGKDEHYDKVVCDEIVKVPLGKVWTCVYGESKDFMMSFLRDNQKLQDISMGDWKRSDKLKRERQVSYTKALNNSVGPKSTRCNITEQIQAEDFNSFCVALTTTTTPDVPSGSSFQVLTKYCMMWAGGGSTRILITCTIEWSKSSWIKGAIEKGASEGQLAFAKDLVSELRKTLESGRGRGTSGKSKTPGKKRSSKRRSNDQTDEAPRETAATEHTKPWSSLDAVGGSIISIVSPAIRALSSSTGITVLLLILVLCALIRVEQAMKQISLFSMNNSPELSKGGNIDLVGEDELWDWVGTRVEKASREVQDGQIIWNRLRNDVEINGGELKDVDEAIRVTERKLDALKDAVRRNNGLRSPLAVE